MPRLTLKQLVQKGCERFCIVIDSKSDYFQVSEYASTVKHLGSRHHDRTRVYHFRLTDFSRVGTPKKIIDSLKISNIR